MKYKKVALGATAALLAMSMAACSSSTPTTPGTSTSGGNQATTGAGGGAVQNAGSTGIYNPSDAKGGTLRMGVTEDWDSTDPGDTYYGMSWNFLRNYARTLVVFKSAPGKAELVPDLATSLGKPSDDAKTWTYTLRDGLTYDDGSPITSKDVAYAVARQLDKDTFPNGPTYFNDFLTGIPDKFSVYKGGKVSDISGIETPDDKTIVFHLKQSFSGFDYLAQLPATAPVPQAKDTGAKYKETIVSSGPYKWESYESKKKYTLVKNDKYDAKTDPDSGRKQLVDKITVELGLNAADIDQRLMAGDLDVDVAGSGVQAQTQAKLLADPKALANTDVAMTTRTWFTVLSASVAPLDNVDCRKAVLYAYSKEGYQRAYGGKTGGDIATSLLPPTIPGHQDFDLYDFKANPGGDQAKAKEALAKCGKPDGFETNMAFRADRPKEKAWAEAAQQSLAQVGIKVTLKGYPSGDYFKLYAGKPDFVKANNLGILTYGWGADWPDGYGFLQQIVDSRVIRPAGNTNLGIKVPEVDAAIDQALKETDTTKREAIWGNIDKMVMEQALVIPGVWAKGLLYRPPYLTNVFVNQALSQYDYTTIGTTKK